MTRYEIEKRMESSVRGFSIGHISTKRFIREMLFLLSELLTIEIKGEEKE